MEGVCYQMGVEKKQGTTAKHLGYYGYCKQNETVWDREARQDGH